MILIDFNSLNWINVISLLGGIILWVIYSQIRIYLTSKQNKIVALSLMGLSLIFLILSLVKREWRNLLVPFFILLFLAFLVYRKNLQEGLLKGKPATIDYKKEEEKKQDLQGRYLNDISYGKMYFKEKKFDKARDFFIHSLKLKEDATEPWFFIGLINIELGRYEPAILSFKKVLDISPSHEEAKTKLEEAKRLFNESKSKKKPKKKSKK